MNRASLGKSILMSSMFVGQGKVSATTTKEDVLRNKVSDALQIVRDDAALTEKTARSGRINPLGSFRIGSYKFKSRKN